MESRDNAERTSHDEMLTPYDAPAVEARTSVHDPLVWVSAVSPICL